MKQTLIITISPDCSLTLINDESSSAGIIMKIKDEGKEIEFATEPTTFFEEIKKFTQFDEIKHLYK